MKLYKLLLFTFIPILLISWNYILNYKTSLIVVNKTNIKIDSVIFYLNNYKFKMKKINAKSEKKVMIYPDSIKLNNHDIIIRAEIYLKGTLFRGAYNYNDLNGNLNMRYVLLLKKDSTTSLLYER